MITVFFKKNQKNQIVAFEITGHANYAEYGSDIVCSAVSALSITTINGIEKLATYQPIIDCDEKNGGYLYFEIPDTLSNEQQKITQILLDSFYFGIEDITENYGKYIKINK